VIFTFGRKTSVVVMAKNKINYANTIYLVGKAGQFG